MTCAHLKWGLTLAFHNNSMSKKLMPAAQAYEPKYSSIDRYRVSLVFHLHAGEWIGRYVAHLPTTWKRFLAADIDVWWPR